MKRSMWANNRALILILVAFLALAITYSILTPIFEAGDEIWHYPFIQHLATGNGLPIQDPNVKTLWEQEGGQPPLYYAISALATFWIDARDLPERVWLNPHAKIGIPLVFGNKNLIVHTNAESFPWHNTALAVHLIRFLSIIFSALTVALTYALAREIVIARSDLGDEAISTARWGLLRFARNDIPAFAAALVACNPMFIFISASVNNDNLATMLATLALLLMTRLVTRGATMQRFVILGIVLGLGALTKISNLGLLGVAAIVFAYLLWRNRVGEGKRGRGGAILPLTHSPAHPLEIIKGSFVCAALVVALAFWWYARNWMLYDDPLAFNVWVAIAGGRATPVSFASLLGELQGFRISFWGNFGGVNIIAPEIVYTLLDAFTLIALIGLVIGIFRRALPGLIALPALWFILINLSLVRWTWLTMASQGRLIFPAISAVAVLFVYGLSGFQISHFRFQILRITHYGLLFIFTFLLLTFAALAPFTLIAPTYTLPARFSDEARVPNPTQIIFDDQIELIGYALAQKSVAPGGELPITIYWRARERIAEDFSVGLRLLDARGDVIGRWDAFPGRGLYPTRLWQVGEIIADEYRVPLSRDARGPGGGRIDVTLYRRVPLENLVARDPRRNAITPTLARFKIAGQARVQIENPARYEFADQLALVGHSVARDGESLRVKLFWQARGAIDQEYTVFMHLVDATGKIIAQKDDQPQSGAYPTSLWDAGEIVADEYALIIPRDLSPGAYKIFVGVYRANGGARLPVNNDDHITLTTIQISN
ncbi:MAG: glycosyltransferase family 39 protein [Chloroflexi bacterium]|nr:glycosyltransferase family 39 protein [Chloroflexota bacterium]